jgi:hypothetical protein
LPSPAPGQICINPKIYALKFRCVYKILWHLDSFFSRDSIIGAVGGRAGALPARTTEAQTRSKGFVIVRSGGFFARHRDYFIVTRNFTAVYQDLVPSPSFIVALGYSSIYRDWQKTRHRDADGT